MTLKIVKPKLKSDESTFDIKAAKAIITEGMVNDTVTDLHSAVKAAGASNGSQVESIYNDLLKELRNLILIANTVAASGASIDNIIIAIDKEAVNFSSLDLKIMMVEVYGSTQLWKEAMVEMNDDK